MPFLVLDRLDKRFGDLTVLDSVSLAVEEGEVLALLGPSGSGKTTLLRLLAGFETPDGGAIRLAGRDVAPLPPARRRFGMVFQHYALFPHLTVGGNVAFGLEAGGGDGGRLERTEIAHRVTEALALVDLAGFEGRRPGEISGGQQQRVALARALATEPRVLLLDEPLSNLDPALRERTRRELAAAVQRVGITTVLVTHEQEEAFDLGDRVAVLHRGRLDQVGTPEELYEQPATRFVATFVGRASVLPGRVVGEAGEDRSGEVEVAASGVRWPAVLGAANPSATGRQVREHGEDLGDAGSGAVGANPSARGKEGHGGAGAVAAGLTREETPPPARGGDGLEGAKPGDSVDLVVRPEALAFVGPEAIGALPGRVEGRRYVGATTLYRVGLDAGPEIEVAAAERGLAAGGVPAAREGAAVHVAPRPEGPKPRAFPSSDGDAHSGVHPAVAGRREAAP